MLQGYIQNYLQKRSILQVGASSVEGPSVDAAKINQVGSLVTLGQQSIIKSIHNQFESTIHNIAGGASIMNMGEESLIKGGPSF